MKRTVLVLITMIWWAGLLHAKIYPLDKLYPGVKPEIRDRLVRLGEGQFAADNPCHLLWCLESGYMSPSEIDHAVSVVRRMLLRFRNLNRGRMDPVQQLRCFHQIMVRDFETTYSQMGSLTKGLKEGKLDCDTGSMVFLIAAHEFDWPLYGVLAPGHFFVRWQDEERRFNFETTSGDSLSDQYYLQEYGIRRKAIGRGVYMDNLTPGELSGFMYETAAGEMRDPDTALLWYNTALSLDSLNVTGMVNRGVHLAGRGQYDLALLDYRRSLELDPDNATAWYNLGNLYLAQQENRRAVEDFSRALQLDPDMADAWHNRSVARQRLGELTEALNDIDKALTLKQDDLSMARVTRATILEDMGRTAEALRVYDEVIRSDPGCTDALYSRGLIFREQKKYHAARADLEAAIAIREEPELLELMIAILRDLGDDDQALAWIQKGLATQPRSGFWWYGARIYQDRGNLESALEMLREGLQCCPDDPELLLLNASLLNRSGSPRQGLTSLEKYAAIAGQTFDYFNTRGIIYTSMKEYTLALTSLEAALQIRPDDRTASVNRVQTLFLAERYDDCLSALKPLLRTTPRDVSLLEILGRIQIRKEDFLAARKTLEKARSLSPGDRTILTLLDDVFRNLNLPQKRIENLSRLISLDPDNDEYYRVRADVRREQGNTGAAIDDYTRAIRSSPQNASLYYIRSTTLAGAGQMDDALDDIRQAVRLDPENTDYRLFLAQCLRAVNRPQEGIRELTRLLERNASNAAAWRERGEQYAMIGRDDLAEQDITRSLEIDPQSPWSWFIRGDIHFRARDYQKAVDDYTRGLALSPRQAAVWYNRGIGWYYLKDWDESEKDLKQAAGLNPDLEQDVQEILQEIGRLRE